MPWYRRAWVWLKKNWRSVLLGVFTLGIGLLVGRSARRSQKVINPELTGAEEEKLRAREEQEQKDREAKKRRDAELKRIEEKHVEKLRVLTDEQKRRVTELQDDPEELNNYLLEVGESMRSR